MIGKLVNLVKHKDKKMLALLVFTIIILFMVVIGAAYAYFIAQTGIGGNANISASTGTTDNLMFLAGDPVNIHATLDNFGKNMADLKGSTTASAKLVPNNNTNEAKGSYNIFFVIDTNDFEYSSSTSTPELVLKLFDPNGVEVEDIPGLKKVEEGFDITTRTGGYLIRSDYDIIASTNEGTMQDWQVEVTLVNLDIDH